jgi:hypothetical protein
MKKTFVALGALVVGGGLATTADAQSSINAALTFTNTIVGAVDAQSTNKINIVIGGKVAVKGTVQPDSIGQALVDGKQLLRSSSVTFLTPPATTFTMPSVDTNGNTIVITMTTTNFANMANDAKLGETAGTFSGATGNVGVSVAAGDQITQDNAVAVAAVQSARQGVKADVVKFQEAWGNVLNDSTDPAVIITNTASVVAGAFDGATGNIGANVAAGYNIGQQNGLAIATATDAGVGGGSTDISLASANVGVVQQARNNTSFITRNTNSASAPDGLGANFQGNAGINIGAGGNLLQNNALAVTAIGN